MKQQLFEQKYQQDWKRFARQLQTLELGKKKAPQPVSLANFAQHYRKICQDLALAKERHYSPTLVDNLNELALRGHQQLYQSRTTSLGHRLLHFLMQDFPAAVRRDWRLVVLGQLLFYLPALLFGLLVYFNPALAFSFFSPEQVNEFATLYDPQQHQAMTEMRDSSDDLMMFGYYISNNIGIGFQTFASGLLFGLGSLFFLIYNGLAIGGVAGYLSNLEYFESFYTFVIGHGAFELTAIGLAGAAGMKVGFALVMPGRLSRRQALLEKTRDSINLVYGVVLFLLIAAFIEAFWSPSEVSANIKYAVGVVLWLLVLAYLLLTGRHSS